MLSPSFSAATTLLRCDGLGVSQLLGLLVWHVLLSSWLCLRNVVLDFSSHQLEGLVYIFTFFGRGLEESHAVVVCHFLTLLDRDCSLLLHIGLVSNQNSSNIVVGILLDLAHPSMHTVERVSVGDVVDYNDSVGSLIVR